jgi:broad specificity phosphatase PhoE
VTAGASEDTAAPRPGTPGSLVPAGLDATLVLIRHGETEYIVEGRFQGHAATPLTPTGRRQAALAGARIAERSPAVGLAPLPIPPGEPLEIAHSPLRRTTETADAVASAFVAAGRPGPSVRPEPGLAEIGQGEWEGLLGSEVEQRWGELLAAWRRDAASAWAPGGESLADVDARLRPALGSVLARLASGRMPRSTNGPQVPGYGSPVPADQPWSILVAHDGVFKIALLALLDLPTAAFWRFPFVLGGITIVELRGGRAVLRAHSLADHLAPLAVGPARAAEAEAETRAADRDRAGAL